MVESTLTEIKLYYFLARFIQHYSYKDKYVASGLLYVSAYVDITFSLLSMIISSKFSQIIKGEFASLTSVFFVRSCFMRIMLVQ